jgi:hypothetical protein
MLEEIMLDKARIVREAADDWREASSRWARIVLDRDIPWVDPSDLAVDWLAGRVERALEMTEADLRRAVKQYLSRWAQATLEKRRADVLEEAEYVAPIQADVLDTLRQASKVAGRMAQSRSRVQPYYSEDYPVIDSDGNSEKAASEYWSDGYEYLADHPERTGRDAVVGAANHALYAKQQAEQMPQPANRTTNLVGVSLDALLEVDPSADGDLVNESGMLRLRSPYQTGSLRGESSEWKWLPDAMVDGDGDKLSTMQAPDRVGRGFSKAAQSWARTYRDPYSTPWDDSPEAVARREEWNALEQEKARRAAEAYRASRGL